MVDFNTNFQSNALRRQPQQAPLNMQRLSGMPAPTPVQNPQAALLRQPIQYGAQAENNPYLQPTPQINRSEAQQASLLAGQQAAARSTAEERLYAERSDYGGLVGAMVSGLLNKRRRGQKLTRYEEEELAKLQAAQSETDLTTMAGFKDQARINSTTGANRETWGAPIYTQNPETSEIVPMQYSNRGNSRVFDTQGNEALLPGSQAAFNAASIEAQTTAETEGEVANLEATLEGKANLSYAEQAARNDADYEAEVRAFGLIDDEANREFELQAAKERAVTAAELNRQEKLYDQEQLQELEAGRVSSWAMLAGQEAQAIKINELAAEAKGMTSLWSAGLGGQVLRYVGGTGATDLQSKLSTLRAYAGFDSLAQMRDASADGSSGLGQLTREEMTLLQDAWTALDTAQSPEQLRENIDRFVTQVEESWARVRIQYEKDYGTYVAGSGPPAFGAATEQRLGNRGGGGGGLTEAGAVELDNAPNDEGLFQATTPPTPLYELGNPPRSRN
jgi:hypothetical protein